MSLTQKDLCEELKSLCPGIDTALVSKMEKGMCEPTEEVRAYVLKALASLKTGDKNDNKAIIPNEAEELLNQGFYKSIYDELLKHSIVKPATKGDLILATGLTDREVRNAVRVMRNVGIPICSSSGHYGYWLGSRSDVKAMTDEYRSRAMDMLRTARAMTSYDPNQVRMDI